MGAIIVSKDVMFGYEWKNGELAMNEKYQAILK